MTDKPAQSDAPSAEEFLNLSSFLFRSDPPSLWFLEFAEAYAALRIAKMQHDNDGLTGAIEYQKEETRKLMRELESLTPSGSEFVNDPEACVAYVKKARRSLHEIVKKAIIEKNELSAKVAQLESERNAWKRSADDWATSNTELETKLSDAETALSKARNTNRELNRLNQELKAAWNADTDRKQWFRYYKAAVSLFGDMATRAETAESALSEALERTIRDVEEMTGYMADTNNDLGAKVLKVSAYLVGMKIRLTSSASGAAGKGRADG